MCTPANLANPATSADCVTASSTASSSRSSARRDGDRREGRRRRRLSGGDVDARQRRWRRRRRRPTGRSVYIVSGHLGHDGHRRRSDPLIPAGQPRSTMADRCDARISSSSSRAIGKPTKGAGCAGAQDLVGLLVQTSTGKRALFSAPRRDGRRQVQRRRRRVAPSSSSRTSWPRSSAPDGRLVAARARAPRHQDQSGRRQAPAAGVHGRHGRLRLHQPVVVTTSLDGRATSRWRGRFLPFNRGSPFASACHVDSSTLAANERLAMASATTRRRWDP